jgi:hypothetical protein
MYHLVFKTKDPTIAPLTMARKNTEISAVKNVEEEKVDIFSFWLIT